MFVSEIAARMSEFEALQLLSKWLEEEDYFSEEDRDALHEFKIGCIVRLLEEGKIKMTKIIGRNSEVMDTIKEAIASPDLFEFAVRPDFEEEFNLEVQEVEDEYYFDCLYDLSNNQLKVSKASIEENCIALETPSQEKIEQCFEEVESITKMFAGEAGSGSYGSSAFRRWTKSGITLDELRRYASLCEKIVTADSLNLGNQARNAAIAQLSKAYQKLSKEWRNPVNIPDGWVEVGFDEYVEGMCSDTDSEIAWFESLTGLKADYDYNVNMTAYAESAVHEDKREQLFGLFKLLASGSVNAQTACSQLLDIGYDLSEIGLSESVLNSDFLVERNLSQKGCWAVQLNSTDESEGDLYCSLTSLVREKVSGLLELPREIHNCFVPLQDSLSAEEGEFYLLDELVARLGGHHDDFKSSLIPASVTFFPEQSGQGFVRCTLESHSCFGMIGQVVDRHPKTGFYEVRFNPEGTTKKLRRSQLQFV